MRSAVRTSRGFQISIIRSYLVLLAMLSASLRHPTATSAFNIGRAARATLLQDVALYLTSINGLPLPECAFTGIGTPVRQYSRRLTLNTGEVQRKMDASAGLARLITPSRFVVR